MKKIFCLCLTLTLLFTLFSCSESKEDNKKEPEKETEKICTHQWVEATCQSPKKCSNCGETSGTKSDIHTYEGDKCKHCGIIQLTLLNYEDYIEFDAYVEATDSRKDYSTGKYYYTGVECSVEITGNTHYKFNNVTITVKFNHYDKTNYRKYLAGTITGSTEAEPFSTKTGFIFLNLAGNGSYSYTLNTPWVNEKENYYDTWAIFNQTTYEVVSVYGTVEEYK